MKVTLLDSQKKDSSRVNLFVDDIFFCGISLNTVAKYGLYVGKDISEEELDSLFLDEITNRFFERAISLISKTAKSRRQVEIYLKELSFKKKGVWFKDISKDVLQKIIEDVIKKLEEYKYIDDEAYARLFIESRLRNRPKGKDVLIYELVSKGVEKEIARKVVEELVLDEYSLLKSTYKKKYKEEKLSLEDTKKISFLQRKGFGWDLIEQFANDDTRDEE